MIAIVEQGLSLPTHDWLANESVLLEWCRLSVIRLSVMIMHCDQTVINRIMISMQTDRVCTWLRQAPNSVEIGLAVFEQWRT
jgi:hypothetical protein